MRKLYILAGALACLSLAACSSGGADQSAEATPAPKKSIARQAPMYAGQEQIQSVQSGSIAPAPDGGVILKATGTTTGDGWTQLGFLPRIYPATPDDGVYEIDVVGQKPATPGAATPTTVEVKGDWSKYADGRVKGVKFISKTNEITAMLPAAGAAPPGK
jgi:hypothetical protein